MGLGSPSGGRLLLGLFETCDLGDLVCPLRCSCAPAEPQGSFAVDAICVSWDWYNIRQSIAYSMIELENGTFALKCEDVHKKSS